jgi:cysteinyl-tRNA synthetase
VSLQIFDSKSQSLRAFEPLNDGEARLYVCGPTVQSAPHVGHLRSAVAFDIVARWIRIGSGMKVSLARNVTDIDDKILASAVDQQIDWRQLAKDVEEIFDGYYRDVNAEVAIEPHATEHIGDMIALIEKLLERGHAYVANDGSANVFFDSSSWGAYGELTNQKLENMDGETDGTHGRRHPQDFALWKASKADEPASAAFDSPWGKGRPGWHIECSAMTASIYGESFDIHGGGLDLRFPHHENELAQSRAAGYDFANLWMHNGLVTVGGQKMSKSLGNGVSVSDLFAQGSPAAVRYWLGSAHYRTTLDYSTASISESAAAVSRVFNFFKRANIAIDAPTLGQLTDDVVADIAAHLPSEFVLAMNYDFNVPEALGVLHETIRHANSKLDGSEDFSREAEAARAMVLALGFGIVEQVAIDGELADVVEDLIAQRNNAREQKDFAKADEIRAQLANLGVSIEDTQNGTTWSVNG